MFQNLCVRVTTGVLLVGSLLVGCSSSEPQSSQVDDNPNTPAATQESTPVPSAAASEQTRTPTTPELSATESSTLPTPSSNSAPSAPGMKIFIDPVTGEARDPTDAERAAMARQDGNSRAVEKRQQRETKLRNGGTAITIEGDPQTPLQGCVEEDGNVTVNHNCADAKQSSKGE
jgi:hypothetical protein